MLNIQYKLHDPLAKAPTRGSDQAAGHDLYAIESLRIPPKSFDTLNLGLSLIIPPGYYGQISPRSGLAAKNGISIGGGVIDSDYRGIVRVILFNHHPTYDFDVSPGMRIAQLIILPIPDIAFTIMSEEEQVQDGHLATSRGEHGFGSTGLF
jgi:dUTP pyrophosphatase